MKNCEEWFKAGLYAAIVLYVCAHPVKDQSNEMYISSSRLFNPKSEGYGFQEAPATKLFEIHEDSIEEFEENNPSRATRAKGKPVLLPLIVEPEAEMLPRGYKGVKPPGVTHMEFAHVKPQTDTSVRESATLRTFMINDDENSSKFGGFGRDDDAHYVASKHEEQLARNDRGSESRLVVLEVDLKDDLKRNGKKTEENIEASDTERSHFENEDRAKSRREKAVKKKQNIYEVGNDSQKIHNAAGRHKNGFDKDDFYDNEHFGRHDRYGEKHVIAKEVYAKDNSSRLVEMEANEWDKFEKTRADREAQGHPYDEFYGRTLTDS